MASVINGYIGHINIGDGVNRAIASTAYGYCTSAANDTNKIVDMTGFALQNGVTVFIKFLNNNTATNPNLNINNTGNIAIKKYGTSAAINWAAGAIISFTYDGSNWVEHYWINEEEIDDKINTAFQANDAMQFRGVINSDLELENPHQAGYTYRVGTSGQYINKNCEIGDLIICIVDGDTDNINHWTIVQTNIDGAVINSSTSQINHIAIFDDTSGKIIKDSGYTLEDIVPNVGIGLTTNNTTILNTGVLGVTTGTINGNISISTVNGIEEVSVKGLGSAAFVDTNYFYTTTETDSLIPHFSTGTSTLGSIAIELNGITTDIIVKDYGTFNSPVYINSAVDYNILPNEEVIPHQITFKDNNNNVTAYLATALSTNYRQIELATANTTGTNNYLNLGITNDNIPTVEVANSQAWRNAIGVYSTTQIDEKINNIAISYSTNAKTLYITDGN